MRGPAIDGRKKAARRVAIVVAFVAFQLTFGPAAGMVVAVFSFGIRDVRAGLMLRKSDPNRVRGRVCSWFYLAHACWCTFVALIPFYMLLALVDQPQPGRPADSNPFPEEMAAGGLVITLSGFVGFSACWIGAGLAMRHEVRVWVDPRLRLSWASGGWPPRDEFGWPPALSGSSNRAKYVPLVICVTGGFALVLGLCFSILFLKFWLEGEALGIWWLAFAIVTAAWVLFARFAAAPWNQAQLGWIIASTPRACYPELGP